MSRTRRVVRPEAEPTRSQIWQAMDFTYSNQVEWLPNQGWDSRIHIAANADLVNVFVLVTRRYVVIVDTLLNANTATTLAEHAHTYLSDRQLLVVNSHADWDHAWGNQLFAGPNAPYPAPIIAHSQSAIRFDAPETLATLKRLQATQPSIFADVVLAKPTLTFDHHLTIDGGDLTLHLIPTPGHTPDHLSIFIPEIRTLLAGDAAEIPFPFVYNSMDLPNLRASLAAMAALGADHVLYCHAPPTTGRQLLQENIAYYNALEAACRAALARGIDAAAVADEELASVLRCQYEAVTPAGGAWAEISATARTVRHVQQLRLMLAWLQQQELVVDEK